MKMKKLLFSLTLTLALALGNSAAFAQAKKKLTEKIAEGATTAVEATKAAGKAASDTIKGKSAEAAKPAEAKPAVPAKAEKPYPMHTVADVIDASAKTFTHKNKDGKEVKHVITAKTEIKNGDKEATFGDIKVGDTVSGLRLKKSDTEYEVVKITKFGVEEKKPAGEKKPKPAAK